MNDQIEASQMEAWILPLSETVSVALGRAELKYLEHLSLTETAVEAPVLNVQTSTAQSLPSYCQGTFLWREHPVPLISLSLLAELPERSSEKDQLVAIVAYQTEQDEALQLGALPLSAVPRLVQITPDQAHPCSELAEPWRALSHAAFQMDQTPYPVLDLQRVFAL